MKKIFYILASAIVALGAVACENDGLDNIGLEVNGDTVSFVASIDNTRTALEKGDENDWNTVWDEDDTIVVEWNGTKYNFTNAGADNKNKFSCTEKGLSGIVDAAEIKATYANYYDDNGNGKIDSQAGTAGALLTYTGSFAELANGTKGFQVENAFLKVTTVGSFSDPFVLTAPGLFSGENTDTWETDKAGTYYIAINKDVQTTLKYSIGGVTQKENEINTKANYIYLLGELTAEVATGWMIVGEHQGWNNTAGDALYKVPGTNTYARCNVTLKKKNTSDFGFKFYNAGVTIDLTPYALFKPNSNWTQSNAKFVGRFWNSNGDKFVEFSDSDNDGTYEGKLDGFKPTHVIFLRKNPSGYVYNNWTCWNRIGNITIASGKNCYTMASGVWTQEIESGNGYTGGTWTTVSSKNTGEIWIGNGSTANQMNSWRQQWSNNGGNNNIGVANYDKAHDIYLNVGAHQPWGFEVFWQVVEHGNTPATLK